MALYPPVLASSMPAFDIAQGYVEIYFNLSSYNRADEIKQVQYIVRRQNSNVSVVKGKSEIGATKWELNNNENIQQLYKIQIPIATEGYEQTGDLNAPITIKENVIYRVQLRFVHQTQRRTGNSLNVSYAPQQDYGYSQWSTVTLIKAISKPYFSIDQFESADDKPEVEIMYMSAGADFIGLYQAAQNSDQPLRFWRMRLLNSNYTIGDNIQDFLINEYADTGIQTISGYNYALINNSKIAFQAHLGCQLQDGVYYKLLFDIETRNGYVDRKVYTFLANTTAYNSTIKGTLHAVINEEQGYIRLYVTNTQNAEPSNYVVRRTSSKSNFLVWEDIYNFQINGNEGLKDFCYIDFTAESGTMYQYMIQIRDQYGRRGKTIVTSKNIMGEWEHAFFLGNNQKSSQLCSNKIPSQLKLKYDYQISSYQTNVSENKTDTIGSKYPYIRRNGNMYYRSFQCSGIITGLSDEREFFISDQDLYGNADLVQAYKDFQGNVNLWVNKYDYTYERKFREKVEEFLYDDQIKLYKSMQEGNILIKLMDISLTPKTQLGRLIYTFSATAYEVDQASLYNLNKYGFITIGTYNTTIVDEESGKNTFGQINSWSSYIYNDEGQEVLSLNNYFPANVDIFQNQIANKHFFNKVIKGQIATEIKLKWLRIEVESDPYLIYQDKSGNLYPMNDLVTPPQDINTSSLNDLDKPEIKKLYQMGRTTEPSEIENVYLGHLFVIDGVTVLISPPNNIYELKDPGLNIVLNAGTSSSDRLIYPLKDTIANIDYIVDITRVKNISNLPKAIVPMHAFGYLENSNFNSNIDIIREILYKNKGTVYDENGKVTITRGINKIGYINIDAQPGVVLKVNQEDQSSGYYIIDETGELLLEPVVENNEISSCQIVGIFLNKKQLRDLGNKDQVQEIQFPRNYDLVHVLNNNNERVSKVYYNKKWRDTDQLDGNTGYIVFCDVSALIQYYGRGQEEIF